jgi:hypothetical protein
VGGEILASRRTPYDDLVKDGYDEAKVASLLEQQHRRVVVDIKLGKYAKEPQEPFGEGLISSRSLDEVILEYLTRESEGERLAVTLLDQSPLVAGQKGWLGLEAVTEISHRPLVGARVTVRLVSTSGRSSVLYSGETNGQGHATASFSLPDLEGSAVVLLEVTHEKCSYQHKALVTKQAP